MEIDRSIDADHVVDILDRLVTQRGSADVRPVLQRTRICAYAINGWCRFNKTAVTSSPDSAPPAPAAYATSPTHLIAGINGYIPA